MNRLEQEIVDAYKNAALKNTIEAVAIGEATLVGYITTEYPMANGNCFGVMTKFHHYKIVNFGHENLEYLFEIGVLKWPVRIRVIDKKRHIAVIHDCRIPANYYWSEFCTICCPFDLLPLPQRLADERSRTEMEVGAVVVDGDRVLFSVKPKQDAAEQGYVYGTLTELVAEPLIYDSESLHGNGD